METTDLSLKTWFQVVKSFGPKEPYLLIHWVAYDLGFIPNRLDVNFKTWQERGLKVYLDLFEKSSLKSFQDLREQYGFASQDFFRFLQLRHHIDKTLRKEDQEKSRSRPGILRVFISAYRADLGPRTISELYKCLQGLSGVNTPFVKEK